MVIAELPDQILANLISCHNFSVKLKQYKAPALYLIGRTFRLVSGLKFQLRRTNLNDEKNETGSCLNIKCSISKWSALINDLIKMQEKKLVSEQEPKSKPSKSMATDPTSKPFEDANTTDDSDTSQVLANVLKFYLISNMSTLNEQEALKVSRSVFLSLKLVRMLVNF